nr:unnamed protein product [Callosobruchus chinensis]
MNTNSDSELPYIIFPRINLKVLLDTGSTKSFIRPEIADKYFKNAIKKDPFQISTVHGSSVENFSTTIPSIEMFNTKRNDMLKFYLFDFHKYFDCLLGVDNLKLIKAFIDLNKEVLILPDSNAKIYFHKTLPSSNFILVEPRTEQIIEVQVSDIANGDVIIPYTRISNLEIPECIATVKNGKAICSILNPNDSQIKISHLEPLKVDQFADYELATAINDTNLHNFSTGEVKFDFSKIRTEHMNSEEKSAIFKLITEYPDIFYIEGDKLTFTSKIKHTIRTKDEIPVYTKSYRYPEIHRKEVQNQIQKMLDQKIIRESSSAWNSNMGHRKET